MTDTQKQDDYSKPKLQGPRRTVGNIKTRANNPLPKNIEPVRVEGEQDDTVGEPPKSFAEAIENSTLPLNSLGIRMAWQVLAPWIASEKAAMLDTVERDVIGEDWEFQGKQPQWVQKVENNVNKVKRQQRTALATVRQQLEAKAATEQQGS